MKMPHSHSRGGARIALAALLLLTAFPVAAQTPAPAKPAPPGAARQVQRVDDKRWNDLADQADALLAKGDFSQAESVARELVTEGLRVFGDAHANTAVSYTSLGTALLRQGKYGPAEAELRRALTIYEKRSGPDSTNTASALNNLALALERSGDFAGAELLLRRSHRILEKALGANHPDTAVTLSNLGRVLDSQGKFGAQAGLGTGGPAKPGAPVVAAAGAENAVQLAARANELMSQGQYQEAETLQARVVGILTRTLGAENAQTLTGQSNLANVYFLQGKVADAEVLHRKVLASREKVLGPSHPDTATSLNNLANTLQQQDKDTQMLPSALRAARSPGAIASEVEALYRRAVTIQENALGPDHPALANTLANLGTLLDQRGRYNESEPMQRRAVDILEKALGPLHPDTAASLTTLAVSLDRQGKLVDAEATYMKAVETARRAGNPRILLLNASRLGFSLAKRGRYREALPYYRESVETLDALYVRTRGLSEETRQAFIGQFSNIYRETIRLLLELHRGSPQGGFDRQVLEIASRNQSRVFTEMMRQADVARFSSDPGFLLLRNRRDQLQERIDSQRQAMVTVSPTLANAAARRTELAGQLEGSEKELKVIEDQLWQRYPRFQELTNPRPVTLDDLQQKLLKPGEVLLSYVLLPNEVAIFAVTRERFKMVNLPVKRDDVARRVLSVRRAIEKVSSGESVLFLRDIDPAALNTLYRDLIAPVADMMAGRDKVLFVGDGPLMTLPMEMLVTRWNAGDQQAFRTARAAADGSEGKPFLAEYGALEYLGKQARFAYLPSLSALTSQRMYPKLQAAGASQSTLVAFADPEFSPPAGSSKTYPPVTRALFEALGSNFPRKRDGSPDVPRLKETADEAREIAAILGGESRLFVGEDAQEKRAKGADLKNAKYVLFATHGFLGGDFLQVADSADAAAAPRQKSNAQPALALSLVGDLQGEDGMLTMKEVIEDIELNADLVALSACNTAGESAQANNGEGFAGLTRAFMYAGARSLLVSHWSVDSLSTQALMTAAFRNIRGGGSILNSVSDAERGLIGGRFNNGPYFFSRSNPFFWAPFVYVGD
jgi:CHAT domain-containing protein/Flp pilus assembly protein TadD